MAEKKQKLVTNLKRDVVRLVVVLMAAFLMATNIQTFVNTGGLYPGGATGLTIIIQRIFSNYIGINVPYSPINICLNAIPIYIGFRFIGKRFTIFSMIMVLANGFFVDLIPTHVLTHDPLLIAVFGGIINATAITMCLEVDATSGGTDFISIFLSQKNRPETIWLNRSGRFFIYFSFSITSFSYSKHSWAMSLESQIRQIRFGMDIKPFIVSEKFQTISSVVVAPTKVISEKITR